MRAARVYLKRADLDKYYTYRSAGAVQGVPTDGPDLKRNYDRGKKEGADTTTVPLSAFRARVIILTLQGGQPPTRRLRLDGILIKHGTSSPFRNFQSV